MATKLFLRNTTTNGITDTGDGTLYDMDATAGSASDTGVVDTTASGTEIQWTKTAGGSTIAWISGRAPAGGFTLTTTDVDAWCHESNMNANIGGRFRVFKRTAAGSVSELGGGPFNDGVEFTVTTPTSMTWAGNVTDTAFAEDDRILVRFYITNVGTMASGHTGTITFNAADASSGDSFFNIAETVSFKANSNPITVDAGLGQLTYTGFAPTVETPRVVNAGLGQVTYDGFAPTVQVTNNTIVNAGLGQVTYEGFAPTVQVTTNVVVNAGLGQLTYTGLAPTVETPVVVNAGLGQVTYTGFAPTVEVSVVVNAGLGQLTYTGFAPTVETPVVVNAGLGQLTYAGFAPTVETPVTVNAGLGQLTYTGFAPTVEVGGSGITVNAGLGELIYAGFAPSILVAALPERRSVVRSCPTIVGDCLSESTIQGEPLSEPQLQGTP